LGAANFATMLVKFLMVGDSAVGKTSVLTRYVDATFSTRFMTTIGVDYKGKKM
jgi:GTPase SAR1 family protein